jgi:hypothetical protein
MCCFRGALADVIEPVVLPSFDAVKVEEVGLTAFDRDIFWDLDPGWILTGVALAANYSSQSCRPRALRRIFIPKIVPSCFETWGMVTPAYT